MDLGGSVSTPDCGNHSRWSVAAGADWRRVDLALRSIAQRRSALDAEEAG